MRKVFYPTYLQHYHYTPSGELQRHYKIPADSSPQYIEKRIARYNALASNSSYTFIPITSYEFPTTGTLGITRDFLSCPRFPIYESKFHKETVYFIFYQLLYNFSYLESNKFCHSNLLLSNVFIDNFNVIWFTDPLLCKPMRFDYSDGTFARYYFHTLRNFYVPPQRFRGDQRFVDKGDSFSIGAIVFDLLFPIHSDILSARNVASGRYFALAKDVLMEHDVAVRDIICDLLDPEKDVSISSVLQAFEERLPRFPGLYREIRAIQDSNKKGDRVLPLVECGKDTTLRDVMLDILINNIPIFRPTKMLEFITKCITAIPRRQKEVLYKSFRSALAHNKLLKDPKYFKAYLNLLLLLVLETTSENGSKRAKEVASLFTRLLHSPAQANSVFIVLVNTTRFMHHTGTAESAKKVWNIAVSFCRSRREIHFTFLARSLGNFSEFPEMDAPLRELVQSSVFDYFPYTDAIEEQISRVPYIRPGSWQRRQTTRRSRPRSKTHSHIKQSLRLTYPDDWSKSSSTKDDKGTEFADTAIRRRSVNPGTEPQVFDTSTNSMKLSLKSTMDAIEFDSAVKASLHHIHERILNLKKKRPGPRLPREIFEGTEKILATVSIDDEDFLYYDRVISTSVGKTDKEMWIYALTENGHLYYKSISELDRFGMYNFTEVASLGEKGIGLKRVSKNRLYVLTSKSVRVLDMETLRVLAIHGYPKEVAEMLYAVTYPEDFVVLFSSRNEIFKFEVPLPETAPGEVPLEYKGVIDKRQYGRVSSAAVVKSDSPYNKYKFVIGTDYGHIFLMFNNFVYKKIYYNHGLKVYDLAALRRFDGRMMIIDVYVKNINSIEKIQIINMERVVPSKRPSKTAGDYLLNSVDIYADERNTIKVKGYENGLVTLKNDTLRTKKVMGRNLKYYNDMSLILNTISRLEIKLVNKRREVLLVHILINGNIFIWKFSE